MSAEMSLNRGNNLGPVGGHLKNSTSCWHLVIVVAVWFLAWAFLPGIMPVGVGDLFTSQEIPSSLISIAVAWIVVGILFGTHQRFNVQVFGRHWTMWFYVLSVVGLLSIPFRAGISGDVFGMPAWLYVLMLSASVVMQQYITFGLLQSYTERCYSQVVTIAIVTLLFYLGHGIFIYEKFAPTNIPGMLFIVALGAAFATIRAYSKTLHTNIALHLLYYFVVI